MRTYKEDRYMSDQFIPDLRRIIGTQIVNVSSFELDAKGATDLIVFRSNDLHIAARVRSPEYLIRWPHDITIRSDRPSGAETELSKIINGFGHWFIYGFDSGDGRTLSKWSIVSLNAFRAALIRNSWPGLPVKITPKEHENKEEKTKFFSFDIRQFPNRPPSKPILVASSDTMLSGVAA
jgi:hypothetical protein